MPKNWKWMCALVAVLLGAAPVLDRLLTRAVRVATGLTSHSLCSAVFVSGVDAERTYLENIRQRPGMWIVGWGMRYHVDRLKHEVLSSFLGAFEQRAVFRAGLGC